MKKFIAIALIFIALFGCQKYYFRNVYSDYNALLHNTKNPNVKPFLKGHLKNGDVVIFSNTWKVDTITNEVSGTGVRYDFNRHRISDGLQTVSIDSVSVFESNEQIYGSESGRIAGLTILTGLDVVLSIYCFTNPKACYGSCPTFYRNPDLNVHYADAEGFSNAIAPSMEYTDVDALNYSTRGNSVFKLTMKNEALETHCVDEVNLLAFEKESGLNIFHTSNDKYFSCKGEYPIVKAIADNYDVTKLLLHPDKTERFSLSDSADITSKETIFLDFGNQIPDNPGLIVDFRQTLMTTYFIYNSIAYCGDEYSDMIAKIESNSEVKTRVKNGLRKELGGIDVYVQRKGSDKWILQGTFYETGPIAINRQMVPLDSEIGKIKLEMNKGLWRVDYLALTDVKEEVKPIVLSPFLVTKKGKVDFTSQKALGSPQEYIYSLPGDEFEFSYKLPSLDKEYSLFLSSEGYYLEWMRKDWLKDKNLAKLKELLLFPKKYLRSETANYKLYESKMEDQFWGSRIDTKTFSIK